MMPASRIGLVRCEHCNRQFNPHSAARHIPWCAKQQSARNRNRLSDEKREALERYKWRIGYRPSNHLQQYSQRGGFGQNSTARPALVQLKKSSINSSSTTSASSSASLSSKVRRDSNFRRPQPQVINSCSSSSGQNRQLGPLQRSVSSLTLTKQPSGNWAPTQPAEAATRNGPQVKRTKSVSDVNGIVESLARRVEEIYAQNQMLLAAMSMGKLSLKPDPVLNRDTGTGKQDTSEEESESSQIKCHHCKSGCLAVANYCHKCGCRLRCPSGSTSPC